MLLPLLLLAGAATVTSEQCSTCNLTLRAEIQKVEILRAVKSSFGFDPTHTGKIPSDVLVKAKKAFTRSLHLEEDDVAQEAIHLFASEVDGWDIDGARFKFENDTKKKGIERADLHLYIDKPETNAEERREVSINVFEADESGVKGELLASHRVLTPAHGRTHHRIRLNGASLERISQKDSAVLIVEAIDDDVNLVILPGDDDAVDHPMSLTLVLSSHRSRSRRDMNLCKANEPVQPCCLYTLTIDFEELGWENVLAPSKVFATSCAGSCAAREKADLTDVPSHESLLQSVGVAPTCCHPVAYEDQEFVFLTPSGNVAQKRVRNLYASKCSCS